jgi:hypothetical protein
MLRRAFHWLNRAFDEDSELKEMSWDRVRPREDTSWVASLTDERLARDLNRLAGDVRSFGPHERRALLSEAASRLVDRRAG